MEGISKGKIEDALFRIDQLGGRMGLGGESKIMVVADYEDMTQQPRAVKVDEKTAASIKIGAIRFFVDFLQNDGDVKELLRYIEGKQEG